jgi:hypothetical protein
MAALWRHACIPKGMAIRNLGAVPLGVSLTALSKTHSRCFSVGQVPLSLCRGGIGLHGVASQNQRLFGQVMTLWKILRPKGRVPGLDVDNLSASLQRGMRIMKMPVNFRVAPNELALAHEGKKIVHPAVRMA